jgi:LacI family transcriptional regulator
MNSRALRFDGAGARSGATPDGSAVAPLAARARRVAVLVETASSWGRGVVEGIAAFARQRGDWLVAWELDGASDPSRVLQGWEADGVIAEVVHLQHEQALLRSALPTVNVARMSRFAGTLPRCAADEKMAGKSAARYFVERGFRYFGYCGGASTPLGESDGLEQGYVLELRRCGRQCAVVGPRAGGQAGDLQGFAQQRLLAQWLRGLPKPVGVLAYDEAVGRQLIEACKLAELPVPQQVAVLNAGDDAWCSALSQPPLSSLDLASRCVGEAAAALLDDLLGGGIPPEAPLRLHAGRIVTRQSTDTAAVEDALLATAVQFIREHRCQRIRVDDVVRAAGVSRRALEKGFRRVFGRSPAEEIRRARVDLAAEMLCTTEWSMPEIAVACGLERSEMLTRAFRRELNTTPTRFRRQHQRKPSHDAGHVEKSSRTPPPPRP